MSIAFLLPGSADHRNITAEPGDDATLPCRAPDIGPIVAVVWKRTDPETAYVLLYRNGKINQENQHPSFKNRVDLNERQLKNRDVSLFLRNVTTNDRGTYECRVAQTVTNNRRETINIINLDVQPPPGEPEGGTKDGAFTVGVVLWVVLVVIALCLAVFVFYKKFSKSKSPKEGTPPEERTSFLKKENQKKVDLKKHFLGSL